MKNIYQQKIRIFIAGFLFSTFLATSHGFTFEQREANIQLGCASARLAANVARVALERMYPQQFMPGVKKNPFVHRLHAFLGCAHEASGLAFEWFDSDLEDIPKARLLRVVLQVLKLSAHAKDLVSPIKDDTKDSNEYAHNSMITAERSGFLRVLLSCADFGAAYWSLSLSNKEFQECIDKLDGVGLQNAKRTRLSLEMLRTVIGVAQHLKNESMKRDLITHVSEGTIYDAKSKWSKLDKGVVALALALLAHDCYKYVSINADVPITERNNPLNNIKDPFELHPERHPDYHDFTVDAYKRFQEARRAGEKRPQPLVFAEWRRSRRASDRPGTAPASSGVEDPRPAPTRPDSAPDVRPTDLPPAPRPVQRDPQPAPTSDVVPAPTVSVPTPPALQPVPAPHVDEQPAPDPTAAQEPVQPQLPRQNRGGNWQQFVDRDANINFQGVLVSPDYNEFHVQTPMSLARIKELWPEGADWNDPAILARLATELNVPIALDSSIREVSAEHINALKNLLQRKLRWLQFLPAEDAGEDARECCFCFEDMYEMEVVYIGGFDGNGGCQHVLHKECAKKCDGCPMCRGAIQSLPTIPLDLGGD